MCLTPMMKHKMKKLRNTLSPLFCRRYSLHYHNNMCRASRWIRISAIGMVGKQKFSLVNITALVSKSAINQHIRQRANVCTRLSSPHICIRWIIDYSKSWPRVVYWETKEVHELGIRNHGGIQSNLRAMRSWGGGGGGGGGDTVEPLRITIVGEYSRTFV